MFTTIHKERSKKKTAKLPLQSTLVLTYVLTLARRKNHLNSKHVFARFAWSKFLLQVLVFRKGSKRKDSPKWKLGTLFLEVAENEVEFLPVEFLEVVEDVRPRNSRQQMFQGCIICNLNLHTFGDHAPHGWLIATIWLVRLLISSNKCGIFKLHLDTKL